MWLASLIGAWLGATILFAAVVAPAAFAVLPSRALAGAIVGRALPVVFISGIVVGAVTALAAWRWPRSRARGAAVAGGVIAAVACAVGQFVVGARIERLRAAIGTRLDALAATDPQRVLFGRLHGVSVLLLGVAVVAALAALAGCALGSRREAR